MRFLKFLLSSILFLIILVTAVAFGTWQYLAPDLPSIENLRDVRLQVPLRVYSADDQLMAEYGEKRRNPVTYDEVPEQLVHAVLAAEDARFFHHPGVDWKGLTRAAWNLARTGEKGQGGSTITMQVARNFFLSFEKTYLRKLNEIILAIRIERELSKQEILSLYLNKIYLGQRAYGVGAAADVYYGKPLGELTLAQLAMIAGLPKAPSRYNPVADPERAVARRNYVLRRMLENDFITEQDYQHAKAAEVTARVHRRSVALNAPYVAEMVRDEMVQRYGNRAYTEGFTVYTTIDSRLQRAANRAIHENLLAYTERHGYRGPLATVSDALLADRTALRKELEKYPTISGLQPAAVTEVAEQQATVTTRTGGSQVLDWPGIEWARPYINENRRGKAPKTAAEVLKVGDIVYVRLDAEANWRLTQEPTVQGAIVALSPHDGAIQAMVGGFDFYRSKFNRATQAKRQPGSNFKPFIYSAALDAGFTVASTINDAPVVFNDPGLEATWRPENYSGKFFGPTRLREALTRSRNLVSIRLLREIGVEHALRHAAKFGFDTSQFPHNLSLALGSIGVTPLAIARGYSVFANTGFLVDPFVMTHIVGPEGDSLFAQQALIACPDCEAIQQRLPAPGVEADVVTDSEDALPVPKERQAPRVVSAQNTWLMTSIMRDVIQRGTGRRAKALGRSDLGGKTGTTNDQRDAWFSGFNHHLAVTAWVGFDDSSPLGSRETGGRAALPMWVNFMRTALEGVPEQQPPMPHDMVTMRIDPETGEPAMPGTANAIFETFRSQYAPKAAFSMQSPGSGVGVGVDDEDNVSEQLF